MALLCFVLFGVFPSARGLYYKDDIIIVIPQEAKEIGLKD